MIFPNVHDIFRLSDSTGLVLIMSFYKLLVINLGSPLLMLWKLKAFVLSKYKLHFLHSSATGEVGRGKEEENVYHPLL